MTIEQATQYLRDNRELIKIKQVAERIKIDQSNLQKAIKGEADSHGTPVKIPARCLPELKKIIKELSTLPKQKP